MSRNIDPKKLLAQLSNQKRVMRGLSAPSSLAASYYRRLRSLVREMAAFVDDYAKDLHSQGYIRDALPEAFNELFDKKFRSRIDDLASKLSINFVETGEKMHKREFDALLKNHIGVNLQKLVGDKRTNVAKVMQQRISENSNLIVSLSGEYKERAREAISNQFTSGDDYTSLKQTLKEIEGVTESRAKLIARDQTNKLFGNLNQARQTDLGVQEYIWRGIDDGRERDSHIENNNRKFRWDDPPETGHPGEDIQCRCVADPVLSSIFGDLGE